MSDPRVVIHDAPLPTPAEKHADEIRSHIDGASVPLLDAFTTQPAALDFVIPGYVSGTVGALAAAGSTGKSFLAMELALGVASAAADDALLQLDIAHHGSVVIFNAEDPAPVLHQRLHAIGQHLDEYTRHEVSEKVTVKALCGRGGDIMHPGWFSEVLRVSEGCRLVIFDTFSRWHRKQENDNGEMAQVVAKYEQLARETGAAVLFLHHVSKGMAVDGRQDEQQATRGASAITDNCRFQCFMQGMGEKQALSLGIPDRKKYVSFGANKENYGTSCGARWYERCAGGVLLPSHEFDLAPRAKVKGAVKKQEEVGHEF